MKVANEFVGTHLPRLDNHYVARLDSISRTL